MTLNAVRTRAHLDCTPARAWEKVCFYEHIELQPTWLLRTALPVPQRTTGAYRQAGDISSCQYSDGGYLTKRIRAIRDGRVDFEVIEQSIRYAGRIDLQGGSIEVTPDGEGCRVEMVTYYDLRATWLRPIRWAIDYVVRAMHRIVLADMRARLAPAVGGFSHETFHGV
ncbi:MAG: hypothetical protein K0R40_2424 [Burkholderiales bacterium]|jgi:hypothetical protein|nr:hypothetical protein [Burkholderiales bacterium]